MFSAIVYIKQAGWIILKQYTYILSVVLQRPCKKCVIVLCSNFRSLDDLDSQDYR